jgi:hypothetical protein
VERWNVWKKGDVGGGEVKWDWAFVVGKICRSLFGVEADGWLHSSVWRLSRLRNVEVYHERNRIYAFGRDLLISAPLRNIASARNLPR